MNESPLRLREMLERLVEAKVRFVLVGGLAVNAWGYLERQAKDVDLDGLAVRVCSLEHLLEMKRASDRSRD